MTNTIENKLRTCGVIQISRACDWFVNSELSIFADKNVFFETLAKSIDPDLTLLALLRVCQTQHGKSLLLSALESKTWFERIINVLTFSGFYTDFLVSNPKHLKYLDPKYFCFTSNFDNNYTFSYPDDTFTTDDIRKYYWGYLLSILGDDLTYTNPVQQVDNITHKLSNLVDATVESALKIAKNKHDPDNNIAISVMAMGKAGSHELNYISDVDVIFLYKDLSNIKESQSNISNTLENTSNSATITKTSAEIDSEGDKDNYTKLVSIINEVCSICGGNSFTDSIYPKLWPLDLNLRPEGKDGSIAHTLEYCKTYYTKWAKDWEFQALLKARYMAGDKQIAEEFIDFVTPLVWNISNSENFVDNCRKMRKKVESNISSNADRNIKLGSGGIRDIEFSIQLLQLVHGRLDSNIRSSNTFEAIKELCDNGYISRDIYEDLVYCYSFLRLVEHRLQVMKMQRTHVVPKSETSLRLLAKSLKINTVDNATSFESFLKNKRILVRNLHKDIFYSPILNVAASLDKQAFALESNIIFTRLEAIGFKDPNAAISNIRSLTRGTRRRSVIHRHLLPVLIEWMSHGANPDSALLNFRILSETVGDSHWYLGFLRDSNVACKYLCKILSNSAFIARELVNFPEAIRWLENENELSPRSYESLKQEIDAILDRHSDEIQIATHIRRIRARELIRCAIIDCIFGIQVQRTVEYISILNDLAIYGIYEVAKRMVEKEFLVSNQPPEGFDISLLEFAVIGMGRLGGKECVYSSDADVLYIYDYGKINLEEGKKESSSLDLPVLQTGSEYKEDEKVTLFASKVAHFIARTIKTLLGEVSEELPLDIDLGLRPEGSSGEVTRSLSSYSKYFDKWTCSWERHALIRCRPITGDSDLTNAFMKLVDSLRYSEELSAEALRQIRRLKARMDIERIPKRVKANRHLKFGIGGLCDVEWAVQILQLKYAHKYDELQTTNTIVALDKLCEYSIISEEEKEILLKSWIYATEIRIANMLASGKLKSRENDMLPTTSLMTRNVNYLLGNTTSDIWLAEEQYLLAGRHCHMVYEKLFFSDDTSDSD